MFTLAVSCLITSNLPWFMDLTFQVPMQYCFLQCQTLLPSPVTSTTGHCFLFGSVSSFFLELFLNSSPVAYWAPTNLGNSSFSVLSFCLFILFMGFSRQEYWSGLPFPSSMDHVLSEMWLKAFVIWEEMRSLPPAVVLSWLQGGITCGVLLIKSVDSCLPSLRFWFSWDEVSALGFYRVLLVIRICSQVYKPLAFAIMRI